MGPGEEDGVSLPNAPGRPERAFDGWFFFHPEAVPERWQSRAIPVALVPLLPGEAKSVLSAEPVEPRLDSRDEIIARLAARGLTIDEMAIEVGMSARGMQHRLARLRERLGVVSMGELRALLAQRGFYGLPETGNGPSQETGLDETNK